MCALMSQVCMGWTRVRLVLNVNGTDAGAPDRHLSASQFMILLSSPAGEHKNTGGRGLCGSLVLARCGRTGGTQTLT